MAEKVILSKQGTLKVRDFVTGALMAVAAAVIPLVEASLKAGELTFNWTGIGTAALGAFVAYVGKKLGEKPRVTTVYKTNKKAEEIADDIQK